MKPKLLIGDAITVMRRMPEASVDAICTDPPYGLEFMGKEWDAPWLESGVNADAGFSAVGMKDGKRLPRPSFTGSTNPNCQNCGGKLRGRRDGSAVVAVCVCDAPSFPNTRAIEMRAFGAWCEEWARECLRVLKPGGHLLAFGGTRTWHRLAVAVEDAGFEIRDSIAWMYGSGFSKSWNFSTMFKGEWCSCPTANGPVCARCGGLDPAYKAFGTGIKPAHEPIIVARKPLQGTVAVNVQRYGTGALNIDGCRVGYRSESDRDSARPQGQATALNGALAGRAQSCQSGTPTTDSSTTAPTTGTSATSPMELAPNAAGFQRKAFTPNQSDLGRWPANVILDDDQAAALDAQSGTLKSGNRAAGKYAGLGYHGNESADFPAVKGDQGGASRFFFVARKDDECDPANTAENSSDQPSEPGGSAQDDAATWGRLEGRPESTSAGQNAPTGTTTTTTSRSKFDGCADLVTSNGTQPNWEPGDLDSRFKYCAKAPKNERPVVNGVAHPTVKPLTLVRWLVRLVTPPGGMVLDPFAGSGTTGEAAILEGFNVTLIEREREYVPLIMARLARAQGGSR